MQRNGCGGHPYILLILIVNYQPLSFTWPNGVDANTLMNVWNSIWWMPMTMVNNLNVVINDHDAIHGICCVHYIIFLK